MGYTFRTLKTLPYIKKKVRALIEDYEKPLWDGAEPRLLTIVYYGSVYGEDGGTISLNHCQITIPGKVFEDEVLPAMEWIHEGTDMKFGMGDGPGYYSLKEGLQINTRLKEWAELFDRKRKIQNILNSPDS
ncbi:hypothetical protein GCM10027443_18080 [Pontibacter brevis]